MDLSMDENKDPNEITKNNISRTNSFERFSSDDSSPATPTSVLPELARGDFDRAKKVARVSISTSPLLFSLRVQALGKLNPIDVNKDLWLHYSHEQALFDNNSTTLDDTNIEKLGMNETLLDEKVHNSFDRSMSKGLLLVTKPKNSPLPQHPKTLAPTMPHPQPPPPLSPSKAVGQPPPPLLPLRGSPPPPPPRAIGNGGDMPPPPPPLGATTCLRPKKTNTKLKRSTQIGNLYRSLKKKVEGTNSDPNGNKSSDGKINGMRSGKTGGKQGMAEALAEMTKRSGYFQKIEEDVKKFTNPIMELKSSISSFETKDMDKLLKFQKGVESVLEDLTDESQVLSRFEGFPTKKLETMRTAVALHTKFENIVNELRNWKIVSPIGQLLDKLERYFDKIKGEVDAMERTKEEESKKFKSQNVHFDFNILIKIKESMVDVSSSCMELALKERREAKVGEEKIKTRERVKKGISSSKMLWRAFQFAFRVYTFAGGHDDRATKLTIQLAQEIESDE